MQLHLPSPGYGLLHDVRAKPPLQLLQLLAWMPATTLTYGLAACGFGAGGGGADAKLGESL